MNQNVENNQPVETQLNIGTNEGPIYLARPTKWSNRFRRLKLEVEKDIRFEEFIDDLEEYNTILDGRSMPDKLADGGFSDIDILAAAKKKERYWKKFEKNRFYETAQIIDVEIFALIKHNFETYINPLIDKGVPTSLVRQELDIKVVTPILKILNEEGYDDDVLDYRVDDVLGMIYFLTGKCHINWKNYDNI